MTALMRSQSPERSAIRVAEWDWKYQLVKVNPLATWDRERIWDYVRANDVPYNELHERGYPTLGCTHCTSPVAGAVPTTTRAADAGRAPTRRSADCMPSTGRDTVATAAGRRRPRHATATIEDNYQPESKVEVAKRRGRHLRGTIAETLASDATHFQHDDVQLLKFHGTYQQDSRDKRRDLESVGQEKAYSFMVRVAIPAGAVSAAQYLALDAIADRYGNGTLRVTTRQGSSFTASSRATSRRPSPASTGTCSPPSPPAATSSAT